MKSCEYCQVGVRVRGELSRPPSLWRRVGEMVGWILPSAVLVLLPKCPVCVAMYVALISGVGISVANAARLRWVLLFVSLGILVGLALWRLWRAAYRPAALAMATRIVHQRKNLN